MTPARHQRECHTVASRHCRLGKIDVMCNTNPLFLCSMSTPSGCGLSKLPFPDSLVETPFNTKSSQRSDNRISGDKFNKHPHTCRRRGIDLCAGDLLGAEQPIRELEISPLTLSSSHLQYQEIWQVVGLQQTGRGHGYQEQHPLCQPPPKSAKKSQQIGEQIGGPIFRQNRLPVPWISVPGPKHTFLMVAP